MIVDARDRWGRRQLLIAVVAALALTSCDGSRDAPSAPGAPAAKLGRASPGDRDPRLGRALEFLGRGDFAASRTILDEVARQYPDSQRTRFLIALSYHKEKRYELASRLFAAVVAAGPTFEGFDGVFHFQGWALYHLGRLDAAEEAFEKHVTAQPDVVDTWFGLGLVALDEDRLDDAENALREAMRLGVGNPRKRRSVSKARTRLADVLVRRGRLEDARRELVIATSEWPDNASAHYKLSRVLARLGDAAGSARALDEHRRLRARGGG